MDSLFVLCPSYGLLWIIIQWGHVSYYVALLSILWIIWPSYGCLRIEYGFTSSEVWPSCHQCFACIGTWTRLWKPWIEHGLISMYFCNPWMVTWPSYGCLGYKYCCKLVSQLSFFFFLFFFCFRTSHFHLIVFIFWILMLEWLHLNKNTEWEIIAFLVQLSLIQAQQLNLSLFSHWPKTG